MAVNPFILEQTVGRIPYSNPAVLSGWFEKKPITIDYDFPGYRNYGRIGQTTELGKIPKNTVFFRLSSAPYNYRPIVLVPIVSVSGTSVAVSTVDVAKLFTWNVENVSMLPQTTELVRIWDDSAEKFMDGTNDQNRYIASLTYTVGNSNQILTLNGALTTIVESGVDCIAVGPGVEDIDGYVLLDEEVNLRTDAKPKPIASDLTTSAIYRARLNVKKLDNWNDWLTSYQRQIRRQCSRIFWDFD